MKRCSTSLVIRELKITATIKTTAIRVANKQTNHADNTGAGENVRGTETLIPVVAFTVIHKFTPHRHNGYK